MGRKKWNVKGALKRTGKKLANTQAQAEMEKTKTRQRKSPTQTDLKLPTEKWEAGATVANEIKIAFIACEHKGGEKKGTKKGSDKALNELVVATLPLRNGSTGTRHLTDISRIKGRGATQGKTEKRTSRHPKYPAMSSEEEENRGGRGRRKSSEKHMIGK